MGLNTTTMKTNYNRIIYQKAKYKYVLREPYRIKLPDLEAPKVNTGLYIVLVDIYGHLCIKEGYAWDGPSGPTIDSKAYMRASLVHDAIYQLLREGTLGEDYRKTADQIFYRICREDGMSYLRAKVAYLGIRIFGAKYTKAIDPNLYQTAP